ncbi:hypothetical protein FKM82_014126 [Ascaphus truei]
MEMKDGHGVGRGAFRENGFFLPASTQLLPSGVQMISPCSSSLLHTSFAAEMRSGRYNLHARRGGAVGSSDLPVQCSKLSAQWPATDPGRESANCVLKAIRVSDNFHARYKALSRTYVYRIMTGCCYAQMPVFERHRCWPVHEGLNLAAIHEAAQLLLGTHDFSAFRCANSDNAFKSPIKTLLQADITPASCFLTHNLQYRDLQFWDFTFKSKSFLYKQVRRMTGALVAVGRGQLTPQHVKELLETRDPKAFPGSALAPPDGLFLKEVEYDEMDLSTEQILS